MSHRLLVLICRGAPARDGLRGVCKHHCQEPGHKPQDTAKVPAPACRDSTVLIRKPGLCFSSFIPAMAESMYIVLVFLILATLLTEQLSWTWGLLWPRKRYKIDSKKSVRLSTSDFQSHTGECDGNMLGGLMSATIGLDAALAKWSSASEGRQELLPMIMRCQDVTLPAVSTHLLATINKDRRYVTYRVADPLTHFQRLPLHLACENRARHIPELLP
eukprot:1060762-Rhodomonas_salina.1